MMPRPVKNAPLTADEFLAWAMQRSEGERYELVGGEIVAMAPERAVHSRVKGYVFRALAEAVEAEDRPCEALPDGMAVRIDAATVYEPDALVRCGPPMPDDAVELTDPVIVVEIVSPSSARRDTGAKLEDYFRLPSVHHYLIVKTENRTVIHHARDTAGQVQTRFLRDGSLRLEPPGITLEVTAFFGRTARSARTSDPGLPPPVAEDI